MQQSIQPAEQHAIQHNRRSLDHQRADPQASQETANRVVIGMPVGTPIGIPAQTHTVICTLRSGEHCQRTQRHTATATVRAGLGMLALMVLTGCDVLLDGALDCLDSDGPRFNKSVLTSPVLNQVYDDSVGVYVDNEPFDNRFDYRIELTGTLPPGINHTVVGRDVYFTGTAIEMGEFDFRLYVEIDDGADSFESGLCYRTRSQNFTLNVSMQ